MVKISKRISKYSMENWVNNCDKIGNFIWLNKRESGDIVYIILII